MSDISGSDKSKVTKVYMIVFSRLKLYEEHEKIKKKKVSVYIKGFKFDEINKKSKKKQINRQFLVDF